MRRSRFVSLREFRKPRETNMHKDALFSMTSTFTVSKTSFLYRRYLATDCHVNYQARTYVHTICKRLRIIAIRERLTIMLVYFWFVQFFQLFCNYFNVFPFFRKMLAHLNRWIIKYFIIIDYYHRFYYYRSWCAEEGRIQSRISTLARGKYTWREHS